VLKVKIAISGKNCRKKSALRELKTSIRWAPPFFLVGNRILIILIYFIEIRSFMNLQKGIFHATLIFIKGWHA
jgi:hypothetical protein